MSVNLRRHSGRLIPDAEVQREVVQSFPVIQYISSSQRLAQSFFRNGVRQLRREVLDAPGDEVRGRAEGEQPGRTGGRNNVVAHALEATAESDGMVPDRIERIVIGLD